MLYIDAIDFYHLLVLITIFDNLFAMLFYHLRNNRGWFLIIHDKQQLIDYYLLVVDRGYGKIATYIIGEFRLMDGQIFIYL